MKIRIDISVVTSAGGAESYSYAASMRELKRVRYAHDMSFCIGEVDGVPHGARIATNQDEFELHSLAEQRKRLLEEVYEIAKKMLDEVTKMRSGGEMAVWDRLGVQARAFLDGSPAESLLEAEAVKAGDPGITATATIIKDSADAWEGFRSDVTGARAKHKNAIQAASYPQLLTYDLSTLWPLASS